MENKFKKLSKYGSAPLDSIIFIDEQKKEEWDNMEPQIKKHIENNMHAYMSQLSLEKSIETLFHVFNDMNERLKRLENGK